MLSTSVLYLSEAFEIEDTVEPPLKQTPLKPPLPGQNIEAAIIQGFWYTFGLCGIV